VRHAASTLRCGRFSRTVVLVLGLLAIFVASALAKRELATQIGGSDQNLITGGETWNHVTQSEDQIAVNGSTVVVDYNDSKGVALNPLIVEGMSVSTNGGASFVRLSPSPFATGHGDAYGDPFVVYNKKLGTWFAGGLVSGCGSQGLGLWTSANGTTWSAGACAHTGTQDDRPSLAVDNTASSAAYGRMYLTYNDFNVVGGAILATHSDDGTTWSAPIQLSSGFLRGLRVAVAPDGTVIEAAMAENGGGFNPRQNFVFRSTNGGNGWVGPASQAASYGAPGDAVTGFFTKFNPIWRNYGTGDLAIGSGGIAIEAYVVHGAGADGGDIYLQRSADNGVTWGVPVRIDGDAGLHAQWMPSVAAGGQSFLIAWYDRRNTTNGVNYERWGTTSTDGGVTWSSPDRISDVLIPQPEQPDPNLVADYAGDYMRDAFENNVFYDAWTDGRVSVMDPNTGGQHFQQDVFVDRISVTPTAADVSAFTATATARGVVLRWRSASDLRLLGFHVWRSRTGVKAVRITSAMVRAHPPGAATGRAYRFVDRRPVNGRAVYRLQVVGLDGGTRFVSTART
jgi:hypothetical protein